MANVIMLEGAQGGSLKQESEEKEEREGSRDLYFASGCFLHLFPNFDNAAVGPLLRAHVLLPQEITVVSEGTLQLLHLLHRPAITA